MKLTDVHYQACEIKNHEMDDLTPTYRVAFTVYATVDLEAKNKSEAEEMAKQYMNGEANFKTKEGYHVVIQDCECNDVFELGK